jgi:hypothetical protein
MGVAMVRLRGKTYQLYRRVPTRYHSVEPPISADVKHLRRRLPIPSGRAYPKVEVERVS